MLTAGLIAAIALLGIWLGYAMIIRVIGGLTSRPDDAHQTSLPSVSVILATRDTAEVISRRVTDLLRADYPAHLLQVVVALDHTRQDLDLGTFDPPGGDICVVAGDPPGGKSATLNAAVRKARNEVLVFADAAQIFEVDAIPMLVAALNRPGVGAVSGMLEIPPKAGSSLNLAQQYWRFERWLRKWEARAHSCVGVTGAIYAMPRSLWEPLPANLILDDLYVPMRLAIQGWRIEFEARAQAIDARQFVPAQEYRRKARTLTGVLQVCAWLPGVLNPVRNPLWIQFVCHKLLRLLSPYLALITVLAIAWAGISLLLSVRGGVAVIAVFMGLLVTLCLVPRIRRALLRQLEWGMALQSSAVTATVNGLRGRWDVWH